MTNRYVSSRLVSVHEHPYSVGFVRFPALPAVQPAGFFIDLGTAYKQGLTFSDLQKAMNDKLDINMEREWVQQPDGTFRHK